VLSADKKKSNTERSSIAIKIGTEHYLPMRRKAIPIEYRERSAG
jgi:hypothetical protein